MKCRRIISRAFLLVLALSILFSCMSISVFADEAKGQIKKEAVSDQVIAIGMAAWLNGVGEDWQKGWQTDLVLWDAAGWYSALNNRRYNLKLLKESDTRDILASLGYEGDLVLPPTWEEYGIVKIVYGAGNSRNYDFEQHKEMFDAMIGVTAEMRVRMEDDDSAVFTAISHAFEDAQEYSFLITFAANDNPNSKFPYKVIGVEKYQEEPEWDPALNFTWKLLMEQNKLSNILAVFPSVKISMPAIDANAWQWTYKHNGEYVQYTDSGRYSFGTYGMYSFDLIDSTDGVRRPCVGSVNRDPMREAELEKMIQNYLTDYECVKFLKEDDDLIWIQLIHQYGFHANAAVDKGTLLLKKMQFFYGDSTEPAAENTFVYTDTPPAFEPLQGWDMPLRTVTAVWETFDPAIQNFAYRTEAIQLPYNWEYYPNEARYGDYAIYTNPRYMGPYQYPGDWIDYSIFLTTSKG
ncbi:MAG: hypothetical protein IJG40_02865 [Oscillospiraceae bacterium]|nr:hypothetical protein [Oscillospiraceae bacterium]